MFALRVDVMFDTTDPDSAAFREGSSGSTIVPPDEVYEICRTCHHAYNLLIQGSKNSTSPKGLILAAMQDF